MLIARICQEYKARISTTIQLHLLYWGVSICQPPAYKQALHLLKILLNTQQSLLCNISSFSQNICQLIQRMYVVPINCLLVTPTYNNYIDPNLKIQHAIIHKLSTISQIPLLVQQFEIFCVGHCTIPHEVTVPSSSVNTLRNGAGINCNGQNFMLFQKDMGLIIFSAITRPRLMWYISYMTFSSTFSRMHTLQQQWK